MEGLCALRTLGRHILAEFVDCDRNSLNDPVAIQNLMLQAAKACGATVVQTVFHSFNPHGVSGVVVIAESHLAIHTWPEYGHAAVDVFTCGHGIDPTVAVEHLRDGLRARRVTSQEIHRLPLPNDPLGNEGGKETGRPARGLAEVESTSPD